MSEGHIINMCRKVFMDLPAGLEPQAQVDPVGEEFSVSLRSHVHSPAGLTPMKRLVTVGVKPTR